jgi:hypothetical protein
MFLLYTLGSQIVLTAQLSLRLFCKFRFFYVQGDWGDKVNILGGGQIGHCEKKNFVWTGVKFWMVIEIELFESGAHFSSDFCLRVGWRAKFTKKLEELQFGCCCPPKETRSSKQTSNTWSSQTSCKVHWAWRWYFQTFVVNCNRFVM